jgi:hypothetical protein
MGAWLVACLCVACLGLGFPRLPRICQATQVVTFALDASFPNIKLKFTNARVQTRFGATSKPLCSEASHPTTTLLTGETSKHNPQQTSPNPGKQTLLTSISTFNILFQYVISERDEDC